MLSRYCANSILIRWYGLQMRVPLLSDLTHPNLINLYELVAHHGLWFFTMELIDGTDLLTHVRPSGVPSSVDSSALPDSETTTDRSWFGLTITTRPISPDIPVLRNAFRQLAIGLSALHNAKQLHRDLKPSNILVDRSGRVVVLDFGLVTRLTDLETTRAQFMGTLFFCCS